MDSRTIISPEGQKVTFVELFFDGGLLYMSGDADRSTLAPSVPQAYLHGAGEAALASTTALWQREITGEGQHIDVSVQQCIARMLLNLAPFYGIITNWRSAAADLHMFWPVVR